LVCRAKNIGQQIGRGAQKKSASFAPIAPMRDDQKSLFNAIGQKMSCIF